jgi:tetratricopeptide (TPR) repeat protein
MGGLAMDCATFVKQGWAEHGKDAEGVMARFAKGIDLAQTPGDLAALGALIVHVSGEHLGRWDEGTSLLELLTERPCYEAGSPAAQSLARSKAILHLCAGDAEAVEASFGDESASGRIRVLTVAASALAGQKRTAEAVARFDEALGLAAYGPTADDPAARALAVTGNNLALELETKVDRTLDETALMKKAAAAGRRFWEISGTWLQVERAEYRLVVTHLAAGEPDVALTHAAACLAVCESNDAAPGELFFANEAVARANAALGNAQAAQAAREVAASLMPRLDDDWRQECAGALAKLDALLRSL